MPRELMLREEAGFGTELKNRFAEVRRRCRNAGIALALLGLLCLLGALALDPGCANAAEVEAAWVVGAGSEGVDGLYIFEETTPADRRLSYRKRQTHWTISWYGGWWLLCRDYSGRSLYGIKSESDEPPETGWQKTFDGEEPAPRLNRGVLVPKEGARASATELFPSMHPSYLPVIVILVLVFSCRRLLCAQRSSKKYATVRRILCTISIFVFGYVIARFLYLATDCVDTSKGFSDVLLGLVMLCCFVSTLLVFSSWELSYHERQMAALIDNVMQHEQRQDRAVLSLEIGEARVRHFLEAHAEHDDAISVQTKGRCVVCQRILCVLLMPLGIGLQFIDIDGSHDGRSAVWLKSTALCSSSLLVLGFLVLKIMTTGCWQRWWKSRNLRKALAEVSHPVRLTFFHNPAHSEVDQTEGGAIAWVERVDLMSAAFFNGRCVAVFEQHHTDVPGTWKRITRTSITEDATDPACSLVVFQTISTRNDPGLMGTESRIDSELRAPLDRGQERILREWLEARPAVFRHGLAEVELQ